MQGKPKNVPDDVEQIAMALCRRDGGTWDAKTENETLNGNDPAEERDNYREAAWVAWKLVKPRLEAYEAALREIAAIENQDNGGDWDEIEQARGIARKALETK